MTQIISTEIFQNYKAIPKTVLFLGKISLRLLSLPNIPLTSPPSKSCSKNFWHKSQRTKHKKCASRQAQSTFPNPIISYLLQFNFRSTNCNTLHSICSQNLSCHPNIYERINIHSLSHTARTITWNLHRSSILIRNFLN